MDKDKAKELARIHENIHKGTFNKQDSNPKQRTWEELFGVTCSSKTAQGGD